LKTINDPLTADCPDWAEDIAPARQAEFEAIVGRVRQAIRLTASQSLLEDDDPQDWHGHVFGSFVPLFYYAGNYRGVERSRPCLQQDVGVDGIPGTSFRWVRFEIATVFSHCRQQLIALEIRWTQLAAPERAIELALIIANIVGAFIKIHPFINGNGRISRLIWEWCLIRFGVSPQCRVHPRPEPPYAVLMGHAMRGNYQPLALSVLEHLQFHAPRQA